MKNPTRRLLLGGAMALPAVAAQSEPVTAVHPDAELLHLGGQLMAAWGAEKKAWDAVGPDDEDEDPLYVFASERVEDTGEIADRIEAIPAATLDGLLVKMLAFRWCIDDVPITADNVLSGVTPNSAATNELLMVSILADLRAMGSVGA